MCCATSPRFVLNQNMQRQSEIHTLMPIQSKWKLFRGGPPDFASMTTYEPGVFHQ